jgi:hypothetical protein
VGETLSDAASKIPKRGGKRVGEVADLRKPGFPGKSQCQAFVGETLSGAAPKSLKEGANRSESGLEKSRFLRQKSMLNTRA